MKPTDPDLPPLPSTASTVEIVGAFNVLTEKFLDRCLEAHLDTALSLESDDWAANCYMQRKVFEFTCGMSVTFMFKFLINFQVVVNGYQGTKYSTVVSERNDIFKPLVAATIQQVLERKVVYSVVGRGGELRGILIIAFFLPFYFTYSIEYSLPSFSYFIFLILIG